MAIPIWTALLSLGLAAVMAQPLFAAPMADRARIAFGRLRSEEADLSGGDLVALTAYASLLVLIPMLFLLGCHAVERAANGRGTQRQDSLVWRVQLLFAAIMVGAWACVALIGSLPDALHSVALQSGSLLDWLKLASLYIAGLILADILFYWLHRAQHRFAWL